MTKIILLEQLREFTQEQTKTILLPIQPHERDPKPKPRPAKVYLMRLPDSKVADREVPYILHQAITGKDIYPPGSFGEATAVIRSIFCTYSRNEQEGGLALLELMEHFRIALLRQVKIGNQFILDVKQGIETLIYPDGTAPFYMGEMITNWRLPVIEREVHYEKNRPFERGS